MTQKLTIEIHPGKGIKFDPTPTPESPMDLIVWLGALDQAKDLIKMHAAQAAQKDAREGLVLPNGQPAGALRCPG
jgi:hypothetical protein